MDIKFFESELFRQTQLQKVYTDNKTFVDCIPKMDIAVILERYNDEKNKSNFNLADFVHQYFDEPPEVATGYVTDTSRSIEEHIDELWDVLSRKPEGRDDSLISLPKPYIVPGGRFREIYYWDSFFTMLGLQASGRIDMIQNMVDNFSFLVDKVGYIPNGNRLYYIGRSQPPFFASMVNLLSEEKGKKILFEFLPQLEKEYTFWMKGSEELDEKTSAINRVVRMPDGSILNRYWDEHDTPRPEAYQKEIKLSTNVEDKDRLYRDLRGACESGWDFSSRWFKDGKTFSTIHTTDIVPVDLNCLILNLEQTIAEAYQFSGNATNAEKYVEKVMKRKNAIQSYFWHEPKSFYFDFDFVTGSPTNSYNLSAAYPLYFNIASQEQANSVAAILEKDFLKVGGLITTTTTTEQQWDAPNGWAPLQWISVAGLSKYNHSKLAREIAEKWMMINKKVFQNTGKLMEKYNVIETGLTAGGGEYESQDGFGWTNGVYLAMGLFLKTHID
ncbi:MAG: alpha,alpha-trehalase TreF [Ginsengibacter sp.]